MSVKIRDRDVYDEWVEDVIFEDHGRWSVMHTVIKRDDKYYMGMVMYPTTGAQHWHDIEVEFVEVEPVIEPVRKWRVIE
jgi:hypothetical protein